LLLAHDAEVTVPVFSAGCRFTIGITSTGGTNNPVHLIATEAERLLAFVDGHTFTSERVIIGPALGSSTPLVQAIRFQCGHPPVIYWPNCREGKVTYHLHLTTRKPSDFAAFMAERNEVGLNHLNASASAPS
jgi:hypothetical protein